MNRFAVVIFCPKGLALTLFIIFDNSICRRKNHLCRTVVLFKSDNLCIWVIILKVENVFDSSPSEFIYTLVIITNNTKIAIFTSKKSYKLILKLVCILIFVNHNILELFLIFFENFRILLKELDSIKDNIIKIHCISSFKAFLIHFVDSGNGNKLAIFASLVFKVGRSFDGILCTRNIKLDTSDRQGLVINFQCFHTVFNKLFGIFCIINCKMWSIAKKFSVTAEYS